MSSSFRSSLNKVKHFCLIQNCPTYREGYTSTNDPSNPINIIELDEKNSDIFIGDKAPDGSQLRPALVFYDEPSPLFQDAVDIVQKADILLIVGTSMDSFPLAFLPNYAKEDASVFSIDINEDHVKRDGHIFINKSASEGIVDFISSIIGSHSITGYVIPEERAELEATKAKEKERFTEAQNTLKEIARTQKKVSEADNQLIESAVNDSGHLDLPSGLTELRQNCCTKLPRLKSVFIPESVEEIGVCAFSLCHNLESVTLPSSLKYICSGAFLHCKSLRSIVIPEGVEVLYAQTFFGCTSLQKIDLPSSIKTIESSVFDGTQINSVILRRSRPIKDLFLEAGLDPRRITLQVPEKAVQKYVNHSSYSSFCAIEPINN